MKPSFKKLCGVGLVGLLLGTTAACGANAPDDTRGSAASEEAESGSLSLALTATVGGHSYRFSRFQVLVSPPYIWLQSYGGPETVLTTSLPTGQHEAYLYDWALERDDGAGNYLPVNATLVSSGSLAFEILNGASTNVSFQFETDGEIVTMGSGTLSIAGRVNERPPVCTVLGDDCGEGAWCPPTGLTGAPLGCRASGALAIGEACEAPADCVGNSTCIDFGSGPACAALCAPLDFGSACPGGGQCTSVGLDYGLCSP
jgi:hypothetical protein